MLGAHNMTLPDFIDRFVEFAGLLANALVLVLTATAYQRTGRRSLLLISISAGIGAALVAAPWIRPDVASWGFWGFWTVATLSDLSLWVIGVRLLIKDYDDMMIRIAQAAAPNGGSAEPLGNSGVGGGRHR